MTDGEVAPAAVPIEPPRRRRGVLIGLGVAGLVLAVGLPAVLMISHRPTHAAAAPVASASPASPSPTRETSPGPGASQDQRLAWIQGQVADALTAQAEALMRGDVDGFLAPAAPGDKALAANLRRRFASLRALKVAKFQQRIQAGPLPATDRAHRGRYRVVVATDHCFAVAACAPEVVGIETWWQPLPAGVRLVGLGTVDKDDNGPHPWELTALTASVGKRTIVAGPPRYAGQLRSIQAAAEKAAVVADRYLLGQPPDHYVLFLAGPGEWKTWYGGHLPDWAIGYALRAGIGRSDVVIRMGQFEPSYLDDLLRHEFGHVATIGSEVVLYGSRWWVTEGIADFIQEDGRPVSAYESRAAVRRYLRAHRTYDGDLDLVQPADDDEDWEIEAKYGLGYYATRCIADKYGTTRLMDFVDDMLSNSLPEQNAADHALSADWSKVEPACLAYTRKAVGL